jgi:hypothetical protein
MQKFVFFLSLIFSISLVTNAQTYEATAEFDKKKYPAFLAEYPYQVAAVENAMMKRFSKLGYRPRTEKGIFNKDKGYQIFAGSIMPDITEGQADFMIKVENKSRKGKDITLLTMIVLQGGEALGRSVSATRADKVKTYLGELVSDIEAENLELDIKAQEDAIIKAEKKLESLKSDEKDLEKKLENNRRSQKDTENEIKAKKEGLEALKGKRVIAAL